MRGLAVLVILCGVAIRFGGSIAEIVIGVAFYGSILWWIGYSFFVKQVPKFVRWARNALLLRRFSRTEMTLDARTFENELAKFSDDLFRARAVRYVRDKDLLVSNESSLVSVKKLAAEVDIEVKRDIGRRLDIAEHLGIPAKLGIRAKLDSLAKLGLPTSGDRTRAKYLDELSLLIEKMNKKVVGLA